MSDENQELKPFTVEYLDTEYRVYELVVMAEDEDDARGKGFDASYKSYHGAKQILSVSEGGDPEDAVEP